MIAALIGMALLTGTAVLGQVNELDKLRLDQALALEAQDSLVQERARLLQLGAEVSEVIDSLKMSAPRAQAFTDASLWAMELNTQLGQVNLQLEVLAGRHDSLEASLRAAYDWEISRLLGLLAEAWDEGLVVQLAIYQEERQALGFDLAATEMRYGPDMTISDQDGPEEIEEKADLMRDKLRMARRDLGQIERRIEYLTRQVEVASRLLWQHDSPSPARGALRDMLTARLAVDGEARAPEVESAAEAPGRRGRQVQVIPEASPGVMRLREQGGGSANLAIRSLQLEVSRLKAREQEIRQFEAVYANRIETFERRRQALLTGNDWRDPQAGPPRRESGSDR